MILFPLVNVSNLWSNGFLLNKFLFFILTCGCCFHSVVFRCSSQACCAVIFMSAMCSWGV